MYLWGKAPGSKAVQVEVLGLDHLAVAAVDPLKSDRVGGIALDQALHLNASAEVLQYPGACLSNSMHKKQTVTRHLLC